MKLVFDLESNGLYQEATEIHCAVFKDIENDRLYRLRSPEKIVKLLERCTYLIGHNIIDYDLPLIKKLTGYEYKGKMMDTVLVSREIFKNIQVPDKMKEDFKEAGKKLSGPHSLAAWGYRLGRGKVEHEDWSVFSPEMMHRCVEDVEITHLLYDYICEKWNKEVFPVRSLWLTQDFMKTISRQQKHGWKLDIPRCERYVKQLTKWVRWIDTVLDPYVPVLPLIKEDSTEEGFKAPFTKKGRLNARLQGWLEKNEIPWGDSIEGPFCRVTFRKVNLGSDKEVKEWLLEMGWQPEEYNYSKKEVDEDGNPVRTSPKLSPDDAFIGVDGKVGRLICKRVQCVHRRSNIQGWLDRVREDGRLESRISGFADTYRVRHANIANVPNAENFFGANMRKCFLAEEGMTLVSADASACQDRMIIARARDAGILDPIFEHMVLYGTKEDRTKSHCRVQDEVNGIFREKGIPLIQYGTAKNFGFAYKFGGQPKKLGFMSGEKDEAKAVKIGTIVKEAFDKIFNAQVQVGEYLKAEWMKTAKIRKVTRKYKGREYEKQEFYNGKVRGLDGRMVLVRKLKDLLVYAVQSDEAICMQLATVLANKRLESLYEEGVDFRQVCFYH
ncbi:MAG: putative DNA polymerase [Prokaryotic dsDNA virus sp.]|nr:MAG: putative DNA polymerase [Prokaryotic dsDNA virus sp.]|tara:strand:+ start:5123 stop:6955 length:1833 start_codon:yes stop_codon:yes gene_type:complete